MRDRVNYPIIDRLHAGLLQQVHNNPAWCGSGNENRWAEPPPIWR